MKVYITSIILACALLAGCGKARYTAETTIASSETITAITTTAAVSEPAEAATAGTSLYIDDPDEERVPGLGWSFEDYGKNGIRLVPICDDLGGATGTYVMSNVVILCFTRAASNKERYEFIKSRSDIFEGIIGRSDAINTITVKLKKTLTDKELLTESEYMNEVYGQLDSFRELSPIVIKAFTNKYYHVSLDY